jgi:putative modified peptide
MTSRFTKDVARALLKELATNDEFRDLFVRNPRAAMARLGHQTPAGDHGVPGRDPVLALSELRGGLASKEKIAADSERMLATYDGGNAALAFGPFDMCAE